MSQRNGFGVCLLASMVLAGSPAAAVSPGITAAAESQIAALLAEKESRTPAQRKVGSALLRALKESRGQTFVAGLDSLVKVNLVDGRGRVVVDIAGNPSGGLRALLASLGGKVIYAGGKQIRAEIPIAQIEALAAHADVRFIRPKSEARTATVKPRRPEEIQRSPFADRAARVRESLSRLEGNARVLKPLVGTVGSEGDASHEADLARTTYGYDGTGVKIGVLSDSVDWLLESQASGNLGKVTVLPGQAGLGNSGEGTAMLEIVHDLAPGADLYFATAFTSPQSFHDNIAALAAAGCQIIIDDVFYLDELPFQDALIAQAVDDFVAAGGFYFSSAGNQGGKDANTASCWEGDFADGGPVGAPISPGHSGNYHAFPGPLNYDSVLVSNPGTPYALFWADPAGASANDYDLFILNFTGAAVLDFSDDVQAGAGDPFEFTPTREVTATDRIVVVKNGGAADRALRVDTFGPGLAPTLASTTSGRTVGHSAAAGAFSVAATPAVGAPSPFSGTSDLETFSSDGLRRVFFDSSGTPLSGCCLFAIAAGAGELRQKPDITAADRVNTSLPTASFLKLFSGTSASAPHAGAIAGLLKSAQPSLTLATLRTTLTSGTGVIDVLDVGPDRNSGAGIVMAKGAMDSLSPAPPPVASLFIQSVLVTETGAGNANGGVEPGESGDITVTVKNGGAATATAVNASLALAAPVPTGVSLVSGGPVSLGSISPGGTVSNGAHGLARIGPQALGTFRFHLGAGAACGQQIDLALTLTYGGGATASQVLQFSVKSGYPAVTITENLDTTVPADPIPQLAGVYTVSTGTTSGRLNLDFSQHIGCTNPKACPGVTPAGNRRYDAYTFANTSSSAQCVIVTLTDSGTACASPGLGVAAYSGTYDPGVGSPSPGICTNYLADPGFGASQLGMLTNTFGFTVPASTTYTVIVYEINAGQVSGSACSGYTLQVAGDPYCQSGAPVSLMEFKAE